MPKDYRGPQKTFGHGSSTLVLAGKIEVIPPLVPPVPPRVSGIENGDF